jgi:hypothetical protein
MSQYSVFHGTGYYYRCRVIIIKKEDKFYQCVGTLSDYDSITKTFKVLFFTGCPYPGGCPLSKEEYQEHEFLKYKQYKTQFNKNS